MSLPSGPRGITVSTLACKPEVSGLISSWGNYFSSTSVT